MSENPLRKQVGGAHYKSMGIQPVEFAHANKLDFFQGSVVKYVTRFRTKNGKADLEKAIHFLEMLIQLEYTDPETNKLERIETSTCKQNTAQFAQKEIKNGRSKSSRK